MNSTNVRIVILRTLLRLLSVVAPARASRVAARLFLQTPPRRTGRAIPFARRFAVDFGPDVLAAWTRGSGPVALLVHGWGGRASQMSAFVEPLVRAGFRVVAFDAPGHGDSPGRTASLPAFAAAIRRVAEAVGPVRVLVGHSLGGAAGALTIADGLPVDRAVLVGAPSDALVWFDRMVELLGLSPRLARETRERIETRVGDSLARLNAAFLGPRLRLPLLLVHDRADREVPFADAFAYADVAPDATLVATDGLGHQRILRDRDVVARAVAFLGGRASLSSDPRPRCRRCDEPLVEPWDVDGTLCLPCGLDADLFEHRDERAHLRATG